MSTALVGRQKTCTGCEETMPLGEFCRDKQKSDGLTSRCKACRKAYAQTNSDRISAYNRAYKRRNVARRASHPSRQQDYVARYNKEYQSLHGDRLAERQRLDRAKHPDKCRARNAIRYLKKPTSCSRRGHDFAVRRREAHHHDYSRPTDVEWLCSACHGDTHRIV